MKKNILIMGPGRSGKTTLAKLLNKRDDYSIISIDDIVTSLDVFDLGISWDGKHEDNSKIMAPFLIKYLKELSEGNKFYNGYKFVIEGTDIYFDELIPNIDLDKYILIGLTYNDINEEDLFKKVRKFDTEDDWSYYLDDNKLREYCKNYIGINKYFDDNFKKYNIKTFDTSNNREKELKKALKYVEEINNGKKNTD